MYKAMYLSPMIPSYDLSETTAFFRDVLGFEAHMDTPEYCICEKDNLTVHFLRAGEDIGQMELYLEVDALDSVWQRIQEKGNHLTVRAPFDRAYGMREIHIHIPQTNALLFIGQTIE